MKQLLFAAPLLVFAFSEAQTGSDSKVNLPPRFNQVRLLDAPHSAAVQPLALRIATWNIHHGVNPSALSAELAENRVDLALLQEVDWRTARTGNRDVVAEMAGCLGLNAVYGIEFEELSQGADAFTGQATLSRLPIRRSRVLRFERQSAFWKPHDWVPSSIPLMQRRLGNRIALITELSLGNRLLVVYNAHLESRSAGAIQEKQLDEILADSRHYPPETMILLGGDLNTKYLPSTFLHKLEAAGFRSALGEHIERTHKIAMALDWIFVSGPLQLSSGAVRRDISGSDHYPVLAVVEPE